MKKLISAFTAEGLLMGLGLTLLGYMITPIFQELINEAKSSKKLMPNTAAKDARFIFDKSSLR
ncbi:hypothetical protein [Alkaliphilus serpentinus]|uniref:Uncharacterized protein n=1 Tax=Alkaliphilus serpentinus TaxID=1482731 RepID=A0A833M8E6_9FIRM|nr:hypothetical protein [Alkaliphilus serpentinus]KAB3525584.1 hypothetical protein F8153_14925 [Alkaliphilus serpentinus]